MKKEFLSNLWFILKDNSVWIYIKKYRDNSIIEVDFEKWEINYLNIECESKTTSNFSQAENFVVLECVNRLLEKWYKAEDIVLEKTYKLGHQNKWRLDILVKKDSKTFLMIECKTWWKEFEKELKNIEKDWWQIFSYFQQDSAAEFIMLYASNEKWNYKNEIIKIEEHYKEAWNVEDFYNRWNKLTSKNGIFEDWVKAYIFESKALLKKDLKMLTWKDSENLFNRFEAILRKHSVSDSPNAFNKIFNLFLAKIYDEKKRDNDELDFQWKENKDDNVEFQVRLINLYQQWMLAFLEKEVEWIKDTDFRCNSPEELKQKKKKFLMFNNVYAIKEVFDEETFEDNAKVLKEVVQMLWEYQIRYPWKQQHLSNFFERLLTTWLKQKSWQFFTPPPIAKFIIKSIPFKNIIENKLKNNVVPELPSMIDYACWSGHFLTETMEEMQNIIDKVDTNNFYPDVEKQINIWRDAKYDWAAKYIYWIEKDYRLVKVAKVWCYFYWDWLAQVIYGDWLDNFSTSKNYRWILAQKYENKNHNVFDFVISNPPYSISNFKWDIKNKKPNESFDLFKYFTDNSSEIEALFIERTSQLLKKDWISALVLPTTILNQDWFYAKAREIILKDFDIKAIVELWGNTFMKTNTNTVILFLKKRDSDFIFDLQNYISNFFINFKDVSLNWIEKSISKYINEVWKWLSFDDYISLLKLVPNENIINHEIFKDYKNNVKLWKSQNEKNFFEKLIEIEKQKLFYFVLSYPQNIVLVKSNKWIWKTKKEKEIDNLEEKQFLWYYFSDRRWWESIYPIEWNSIDESTKLYDIDNFYNTNKASTFIYDSFENKFDREIWDDIKDNIFRAKLSDLITFDRANFEKSISLNFNRKIEIKSKYQFDKLKNIIIENPKSKIQVWEAKSIKNWNYKFFTSWEKIYNYDDYIVEWENIFLSTWWNAIVKFYNWYASYSTDTYSIKWINNIILTHYLYLIIESIISEINSLYFKWQWLKHLQKNDFHNINIPLPPLDIQQKIVDETKILENEENEKIKKIENYKNEIVALYENSIYENSKTYRLSDNEIFEISIWKRLLKKEILLKWKIPVYSANVFEPFGYVEKSILKDFSTASILWWIDGDWMVNYIKENIPFYPTDHCWVLRIKNWWLNEKFVSYFLNKEWINFWFSRTNRASIDRIEWIKFSLPSLETQKQIVLQIEKIESEIDILESDLKQIPEKKKEVLKKYL